MAQVGHGEGRRKKSKTGEDDSYHTAQVALETEEERRAKNGLDMIWLIWIEIGVSRTELARPVMGTIFLVLVYCMYLLLQSLNRVE